MRLSIVSTMYRSASYLREFHRRASEAAQRYAIDDYEIVLVHDGSPDESLEIALELRADDPHLRIVDLSRNFGHHQAIWIGMQQAKGDWVFLIDCDLEEAPEWLADFETRRIETGADVVYGKQRNRNGSCFSRLAGTAYYRVYNALSTVAIPENMMTVRLMSRRYIDALLQHTEATFVISGLWARTGFLQVPHLCKKGRKDSTTYGVFRCFKLFVNTITSSSEMPLFAVFYLGVGVLGSASVVAAYLVVRAVITGDMLSGWPSLMVSIWFLGGLILFCQGVLGIYLGRIFQETKRRPIALIRQVYEAKGASGVPLQIAR